MIGERKAHADIQTGRHRDLTFHGAAPRGHIDRAALSRAAFSFEHDGHVDRDALTAPLLGGSMKSLNDRGRRALPGANVPADFRMTLIAQ